MNCVVCGKSTGRNKYCCSKECYSEFRQNYKVCAVCGIAFKCSPTNAKRCCSKECSYIFRSELHRKGVYDDSVEKMIAARDAYIAEHSGSKHFNAKYWVIESPEGKIYECQNLMHFIRSNPEMFDGTLKQAYDGIVKIKASVQGKRKMRAYTWKGWKLITWKD